MDIRKIDGCNNPVREKDVKTYKQCRSCANLYTKYKIRTPDRDKLYKEQDGKCKICNCRVEFIDRNDDIPEFYQRGVVDHCHTTKEIRGILCHKCNLGLGHFEDNEERMLKAIEYLKEGR